MRKRRILAWLMAMVMAIGLMPATALAKDGEHDSSGAIEKVDKDFVSAKIDGQTITDEDALEKLEVTCGVDTVTYKITIDGFKLTPENPWFYVNVKDEKFPSNIQAMQITANDDVAVSDEKLDSNGLTFKVSKLNTQEISEYANKWYVGKVEIVYTYTIQREDLKWDKDDREYELENKVCVNVGKKTWEDDEDIDFKGIKEESQVPTAPTAVDVVLDVLCSDHSETALCQTSNKKLEATDYTIGRVYEDNGVYAVDVKLNAPEAHYDTTNHVANDEKTADTELTYTYSETNGWTTTDNVFNLYIKAIVPEAPTKPEKPNEIDAKLTVECATHNGTASCQKHEVAVTAYTIGNVYEIGTGYAVDVTLNDPEAYYDTNHVEDDEKTADTELTYTYSETNGWTTTDNVFNLYIKAKVPEAEEDTDADKIIIKKETKQGLGYKEDNNLKIVAGNTIDYRIVLENPTDHEVTVKVQDEFLKDATNIKVSYYDAKNDTSLSSGWTEKFDLTPVDGVVGVVEVTIPAQGKTKEIFSSTENGKCRITYEYATDKDDVTVEDQELINTAQVIGGKSATRTVTIKGDPNAKGSEFHTMFMDAIRNKVRDAEDLDDSTNVTIKRVYFAGKAVITNDGITQTLDYHRKNNPYGPYIGVNDQGTDGISDADWWRTLNSANRVTGVREIRIVAEVNGKFVETVVPVRGGYVHLEQLEGLKAYITEAYLGFDVTFKAKDESGEWKIVQCNGQDTNVVFFDSKDGGTITPPKVEGENVKWYTDEDCTQKWNGKIVRDTILYAGVDNPNPPVEETKKKIIVTFGPLYDGGSWGDSVSANDSRTFTLWSDTASAECKAPGVVAPEGKEFVKWEGNLGNRSLDDGASFCYNDFKDFVSFDYTDPTDGVPTGYISFYPVYKDAEVPVAKTLKIYWAIDNPAGAEWVTNGNSDAWTETIAWSDKDNTFVMPSLEIKEGYKLNGWSVSGTTGNFWDADTKTFGLTGLIVEDENGGYVSITANIVSDQPGNPDADKTLRIHWAIDNPNGAEWVTYGNSNAWTETIAWSNKDNTFVMPSLEIKEGYKLNGWSVSGTTGNFWDADTKTFGLTGLIVEDENGGYVSITANIVRDQTEETEEITVHFYISNEEAGNYIIGEEKVKNHDVTVGVKDKVTFPELEYDTSKYELTGWQVDGRYSVVWDAEAFEMLVEGLDNNGHISVTPLFKLKNTSSEDKADLDIEKELVEVNGKEWNGKKVSKGDELTYYITVDNFDGKKDASFITVIDKATNLKNGEFIGIIEDGDLVKFNKNDEIKTEDDIVITKVNDDEVMIDELPKGTSVVLVYEGTVSSSSKDVTNVAIAEDKEGKELDRSEKVETGVKDSSGAISSKNRSTKPSKVEEVLNTEDHFQYVQGYPDNTVGPERNITRAEATVIFFRLLNDSVRTKYLDADNAFADVNLDDWFNLGVSTMENGGFVSGYDDGLFRPNAYITRAELATIISNFDDLEPAAENKFADVEGHWAEKYINSAAEKGWLSGYEDGLFRPNQYITRAETMSMINRVLDRRVDADGLHAAAKQWKDNPESKWYYYAVLEATNYHEYERADVSDYENWTAIKAEKVWEN